VQRLNSWGLVFGLPAGAAVDAGEHDHEEEGGCRRKGKHRCLLRTLITWGTNVSKLWLEVQFAAFYQITQNCFASNTWQTKLTNKEQENNEGSQLQRTCIWKPLQLGPHLLNNIPKLFPFHAGFWMQAILRQDARIAWLFSSRKTASVELDTLEKDKMIQWMNVSFAFDKNEKNIFQSSAPPFFFEFKHPPCNYWSTLVGVCAPVP